MGATGSTGSTGATGPAGPVAGSTTQVIFNDAGAAAGDADLTWDKTNNYLSASKAFALGATAQSFLFTFGAGDTNWRIGMSNTSGSSGGATYLTRTLATSHVQYIIYGPSSGQGFAVGNPGSGTALEIEAVSRTTQLDNLKVLNTIKTAAQAQTIADNGAGGSKATATLTPTTSFVRVSCSDVDGCTETLSETGAVDGQILRIINASANGVDFTDTSGVTEMAGNVTLAQYQSLSFIYSSDRWIETARSAN